MATTARFPPQSNAEDWIATCQLTSATDGVAFDPTGWTATIRVATEDDHDYPDITSTSADVAWQSEGVLQWTFRAATMSAIEPGIYDVGLLLTNGTDTRQVFLGRLPVIEGL